MPTIRRRGDPPICRFLAYIGEPVFLDRLVCEPAHSLLHRSLQAERAKTVTNGDGFGIGWYGEREAPAAYREVMPAWSDENLSALCHRLRSPLFFAHVRAATGTAIAPQNSQPLRFSAALADGEHLHVFRLASDAKPPSVYVHRSDRGTAVASEPLDDDDGHWRPLRSGSVVTFDRVGHQVEQAAPV